MRFLPIFCIAVASLLAVTTTRAQQLVGSRASLNTQENQAHAHDFTYLKDGARVDRFVAAGFLVAVDGNDAYDLHDVSYPFARPAVKLFIERLASQFHDACGQKLTVTSLTRPMDGQPPNSSDQSVHPTGMAVDLRVPETRLCRQWLEWVLLSLEETHVLEATRERNPPHYHVAVFPDPYTRYVESLASDSQEYIVRKGDSLTGIARTAGTTVEALKAENGINDDLIRVGQSIRVPSKNTQTYHVKPGDSLTAIARLYDTTVSALAAINGLTGNLIRAGQILIVPTP